jgi:hypothetical protein
MHRPLALNRAVQRVRDDGMSQLCAGYFFPVLAFPGFLVPVFDLQGTSTCVVMICYAPSLISYIAVCPYFFGVRRVNCAIVRPCSESAMSCASRLAFVASCLALITHQIAAF